METIAVSEFRASLQKILKRVEAGATITIVSRGRSIAQLVPPEQSKDRARQALRELATTAIVKDVLSPIDESWEAMK